MLPRIVLMLATLALLCACRDSGGQRQVLLRCQLSALEAPRLGGPVRLRWELANDSSFAVSVLAWQTPLEGFRGPIFAVTRDGEEVAYLGPVVKRADPTAESYVRLPAGGGAIREVDLAEAYDLAVPGRYRVTFPGGLLDVAPEGVAVPRGRAGLEPVGLECPPLEINLAP